MLRSWLFVPGDSERKLARGLASGADALILDLEDAVDPQRRPLARTLVADLLRGARGASGPQLWVRVNPVVSAAAREDLAAILPCAPHGIVLPKATGPGDVRTLSGIVDQHDPGGSIGIMPIVTETPEAVLRLAEYREPMERVRAMTWGMEDLGASLGCAAPRDESGHGLPVFQHAEALVLLAAAALGVWAIDGIFPAYRDSDGLRRRIAAAKARGFAGMLAIHPDQVSVIAEGFRPTAEEVAEARRIVQAFAAAGGAGVVALDGRMLDRPHLRRAERLLAAAARDAR